MSSSHNMLNVTGCMPTEKCRISKRLPCSKRSYYLRVALNTQTLKAQIYRLGLIFWTLVHPMNAFQTSRITYVAASLRFIVSVATSLWIFLIPTPVVFKIYAEFCLVQFAHILGMVLEVCLFGIAVSRSTAVAKTTAKSKELYPTVFLEIY